MFTLKKCPHCGKTETLCVGNSEQLNGIGSELEFAVCCNTVLGGCGATGGYSTDFDKAIEKWNMRADE